jgi:excisionase family DNA binding protein
LKFKKTKDPRIALQESKRHERSNGNISLATTRENTCGNTGDQINQSVNMIINTIVANIRYKSIVQHVNMKTISQRLDVSVKTIRRLIAAKGIHLYKVGSTYVIQESDVKDLLTRVYSVDEIADELLRGDG